MSVTRCLLIFLLMSFSIAAHAQAPQAAKSTAAKPKMKSSEAEIRVGRAW
jgi:hypothetical protein